MQKKKEGGGRFWSSSLSVTFRHRLTKTTDCCARKKHICFSWGGKNTLPFQTLYVGSPEEIRAGGQSQSLSARKPKYFQFVFPNAPSYQNNYTAIQLQRQPSLSYRRAQSVLWMPHTRTESCYLKDTRLCPAWTACKESLMLYIGRVTRPVLAELLCSKAHRKRPYLVHRWWWSPSPFLLLLGYA